MKYSDDQAIALLQQKSGIKYSDEQLKILTHRGGLQIVSCAGSGKALVNGTGVLTNTGYIPIESLKVGDKVFDNMGREQTVLGVYPQGKKKIYEVVFNNRDIIRCCKDHLWTYKQQDDIGWDTCTTLELMDKVSVTKELICIPMNKAVNFKNENTLPVEAYKAGVYLVGGLLDEEDEIGATESYLGKYKNKHIPDLYKHANIDDRRALINGICDTLYNLGKVQILSETSRKFEGLNVEFIKDLRYVLETLGYMTYLFEDDNTLMCVENKDAERFIIEIRETNVYAEMTCIKVSGDSHLFLTEHCIVTHNTTSTVHLVAKRIMTGEIENPKKLLMTTFSKSGADEMSARINALLESVGSTDKVEVKTMHASYYKCLAKFGLVKPLCSNAQRKQFIRKAIKDCKLRLEDADIDTVDTLISYQINNMLSDDALYKSYVYTVDLSLQDYANIRTGYAKLKNDNGLMDFDDLQYYMYYYLCVVKYMPFVNYCRSQWEYFYVDEFQDTSRIQFKILQALIQDSNKLVVIGDDDQCFPGDTLVYSGTTGKYLSRYNKRIDSANIEGNFVLTGCGQGEMAGRKCNKVIKKEYSGDMIRIKTQSGKELVGTPNHTLFVNRGTKHYVYVAFKMAAPSIVNYRSIDTFCYSSEHPCTHGVRNRHLYVLGCCNSWDEAVSLVEKHTEDIKSISHKVNKNRVPKDCLLQALGITDDNLLVNWIDDTTRVYYFDGCFSTSKNSASSYLMTKDTDLKEFMSDGFGIDTDNLIYDITTFDKALNKYYELNPSKNVERYFRFTDLNFKPVSMKDLLVGDIIPVFGAAEEKGEKEVVNDKIIEITTEQYDGFVYDLSIPKYMNYFANDILVHNCIYAWRGADPSIILNIGAYYSLKKCYLSTNYRCRDNILNFAATGVVNMYDREQKQMLSYKPDGEVEFCHKPADDLYEIARATKEYIKQDIANGISADDIAVLVRNNAYGSVLSNMLMLEGIYVKGTEEMKLSKYPLFKDLESLVALTGDEHNDDCYDSDIVSKLLWRMVAYMGVSGTQAITELMDNKGLGVRDSIALLLRDFLCCGARDFKKMINIDRAVRYKIDAKCRRFGYETRSGLNSLYEILKTEDREEKLRRLIYQYKSGMAFLLNDEDTSRVFTAFFRHISDILDKRGIVGLEQIINMTKQYESGHIEILGEKVTLTTVHSSKGMEWKHVIIMPYDNLAFPSFRNIVNLVDKNVSVEDIGRYLDGERRLNYVGLTRAIDKLTLIGDFSNFSLFGLEALGIIEKMSTDDIITLADKYCRVKTFRYDLDDEDYSLYLDKAGKVITLK